MASAMTAVNPVPFANAAGNTAASGGSSSGDSSTISANDFLTLLVTEMKNQDPTAQTDPNEYINQLVQVNSLEQLIQINQELSTAVGSANPGSGSTTGHVVKAGQTNSAIPSPAAQINSIHQAAGPVSAIPTSVAHDLPSASGNLSVPPAIPAAQRIANALSGHE